METGSVSTTTSTVISHFLIVFGSLPPPIHPSPYFHQHNLLPRSSSSLSSPPPQPSHTYLRNFLQPRHRWKTRGGFTI
ncbi:hypothetical protein EXN66_Car018759 [Channa argus]|uniref:Uncharacterized protein n=1 Tax=Channa argus TaxID=215402 RepID=A0A6G1QK62_CHAAH|nr:hypothetical protein EXN66_Car018759 [Channa argus]